MLIQSSTNVVSTQPIVDNGQSAQPIAQTSSPLSDTTVSQPTNATKEPTSQELQSAVDILNKAVKENHTNLDISIDSNTKEVVVKVVDSSNGDVITQFPSKVALAISASIDNKKQGILLSNKA
jgi:flagellar protein FlaG